MSLANVLRLEYAARQRQSRRLNPETVEGTLLERFTASPPKLYAS
jgi:hypothetical protein